MVFGLLPAPAIAADTDNVTTISSAKDFAAMKYNGNYKLKKDIEVTTPYTSSFRGTFDGDGHTVTLKLNVKSGNAGLFSETGSGAVIENVVVDADVTSTASYSYPSTGGLIGKVSGATTITNCGVTGTVSNTATSTSSAVYIGGLVGYQAANLTINDSYTTCKVTSSNLYSSSSTGGLIGKESNSCTLSATNCYTTGAVTAAKGYAGGMSGYIYCSASDKHSYTNCYTAGSVTVTGAASNAYGFAYSYASTGYNFTNCYYNSINAKGCNKTDATITAKTSNELIALADTLGKGFRADTQKINNGYPILDWQYFDPDAQYTVTFTVEPTDSVLTWNGEVQPVSKDGKYTFENMDVNLNGYSYSISNADDYATQSGTVTVKNKDVTVPVTLELNKHTLTFALTPEDAELTVMSGETKLEPTGSNTYSVTKGEYTYSASAFGYKSIENATVTVPAGDKTETVSLTAQPMDTITFTGIADDAKGVSFTVTTTVDGTAKTMSPEAGTYTYKLPAGYVYDWTFKCANYAKQTGKLDLTGLTEEKTESVSILMTKKTAWEGADDITAPEKVGDVYQITSGSELAWLAQEVNAGRGASYNAVLCNNIDLGNENWTPIGKTSSYPYKGTFDGQGHTIQNLLISGDASRNCGLFGYVDSGTIENLTVQGKIELTGNGDSSYGAAGIVGQLYGMAGSIRNCRNDATIHGGQNVGGIVGYVNGGYSSAVKAITNCVNTGKISSSSNNAGGIVGYISGQVTVDSCYNRGTITGGGWRAGGITAYLNSNYATIKNCYTTGSVSGSDSNPVVGKKGSGTISNCYYLDTLGKDPNAESKTSDELKALASTLGGAFIAAPADINDGYPIFRWQIPTYAVTFTVAPANAQVTIDGQTGTQSGKTWTFALPDGEYNYTVSAFGYEVKSGKITVSGGAVHENVNLSEVEKHTVKFAVTNEGVTPTVTVLWNGQAVTPEPDGSYLLPEGNYTYTVKAKGYAKVSEPLTVPKDAVDVVVVSVTLTTSTAWGGKDDITEPSQVDGVYQITSGSELAWLANAVNNADSGAKFNAELTDDIDLGGNPFTPIGKDFHEFSGVFDGKKHTVTGLNVSGVADAGLFGVSKAATIKNVVVQGTVSGTDNAAGILAKAKTTACTIENCGSEVTVTSTGYAGGILGNIGTYGVSCSISGCYNTSPVTSTGSSSSGRAAGIIGYDYGKTPVTDCYNTGNITASSGYAGGIRGQFSSMAGAISGCYNAGAVTGSSASNTGAIAPGGKNTLKNCFYLNTGSDQNKGATALTLADMQSKLLDKDKLGTENWKSVRGVNNSLPVLKWQSVSAPTAKVKLVSDAAFVRSVINTEDGDETSLPTAQLQWKPVPGAKSYTVSLWQVVKTWVPLTAEEKAEYDAISSETSDFPNLAKLEYVKETAVIGRMTAEQKARLAALDAAVDEAASDPEQTLAWYNAMENRAAFIVSLAKDNDLGSYTSQLTFAQDISGVTGTQYDLTDTFAVLPEGIYYAAVAVETDRQAAYVSSAQVNDEVVGIQSPYNRMKTVTGVQWDGATAKWDGQKNFTGIYKIDLYWVDGSEGNYTYTSFRSFSLPGQYTAANLANAVAAEKQYAFTVTAIADSTIDRELGLTDSIPSAYSEVYNPSAGTEKPEKEWEEISTAEQWIALANVKDEPSAGTDSPSNQAVEWSKNYRLTADIDFSKLSAADQMKTKSIGTVTYPFLGEFDGQGHKITGLTLSNSDSGLFWYIGATGYVHDLTIDSANVLFSDNAAVLAHNNYGRIEHCAVVNTNITADTGAVLGGMVSRNYGVIRDSYVEGGTLTSNSLTATGHAGFVGANETGGLIERCWTSMNVSTQSEYSGGFVGLGYGGTIKNCFALGNVSARGYSGGFVGRSVYKGNVYKNCYAAGTVTVTGAEGNGFIGGNQPSSAFQYDQSEGIKNCYYNSATSSSNEYGAIGKSLDEMKTAAFLTALSGSADGVWTQDADHNNGLPYLSGVKVPETAKTTQITVNIAVAAYNKDTYSFEKSGDTIPVTMDSNGNTRLVDLMDAAQAQGKLTYTYSTSTEYGRFIHTINGREVNAPDGWMFTINDKLSNVSASLATVKDGNNVLWFEGTTENHFQGPTWKSLSGEQLQWNTISTKEELLTLANATDGSTLSKNYKLANNLDLTGINFPSIGTAAQPFTGRFDGQNHTISNIAVSGTDNVGFFGVIKGAKIQNLNLKNVSITGVEKVGGLVGYAQAELDKNDLSKNMANLIGGCTVSGTVTGSKQVGGLVGLNEGDFDSNTLFSIASTIDKSSADVTVTGKEKTGGLVGENTGTITKSAATGAVSGTSMTGGFAGSSSGDIYDSHAEGAVSGKSSTGGFAGSSSGAVKNCYSLGAVTGTDYTGSFAGSLSKADTVIGAGLVTIVGTPTHGYNGGLAGQLGGVVAGLEHQITVKNAFGNCVQTDGAKLSVIGNTTAYPSDTQKAALEGMTLSTRQAVGDKLYELFGINLPDLKNEADKYVDALTVNGTDPAGTALSLLKSNQSPAPGVTVTYSVTDAHLTGGKTLTLAKGNDTVSTISASVQLRLADTFGSYHKTVQVILPVAAEKRSGLMDAIAKEYTGTKDGWTAMDMAVYSTLGGKTAVLTESAKQNVLNLLIKDANNQNGDLSDHSRIEIVLRSLGIDSTQLYSVNSSTPTNNAKILSAADFSTLSHYTAPYILLANLQGNVNLTAAQINALIGTLKTNMGSGLFESEWNGVTYSDPDTAGAALAALAKYYDTNADAKTVVDAILKALPGAMNEAGSFGSANSDAMVIMGLLALGKDPAKLTSASGVNVVDGLLSYVNTDTNQFQFYGADNALATEQAFRALVAMAKFDGHTPYNVFDFHTTAVVPGRATGAGESSKPVDPPAENNDITVTVAITADNGTVWLPAKSVTVKDGSTVYHAFVKALEGTGITQDGAAGGYVRSITKDGRTLAEFTLGKNSGWLYQVNGTLPNVSITQKTLAAGDAITFYYTADWTTDPGAGSMGASEADQKAAAAVSSLIDGIGTVSKDSGSKINAARAAYENLTDTQKALVSNYHVLVAAETAFAKLTDAPLPFVDVDKSEWYYTAVQYAYENGLFSGTSATTFAPEDTLSRSMVVSVLYRLSGSPSVTDSRSFSDVSSGLWYTDAVNWAAGTSIVDGVGDNRFAPEGDITREQLATILYRYAKNMHLTDANDAELSRFKDADTVSDWAAEAMVWAVANGLISGTSDTTLSPKDTATRAQFAQIMYQFSALAAQK